MDKRPAAKKKAVVAKTAGQSTTALSRKAFDDILDSSGGSDQKISPATLRELAKLVGMSYSEAKRLHDKAKERADSERGPMPFTMG